MDGYHHDHDGDHGSVTFNKWEKNKQNTREDDGAAHLGFLIHVHPEACDSRLDKDWRGICADSDLYATHF